MEGKQANIGCLWNNASQWVQKQYFNATHSIEVGFKDELSPLVNIFGYSLPNQQARLIYSSILWFTYREGLIFKGSNLHSDIGWGCMLRVGQMALAEALRRTEGFQKYGDANILNRIVKKFTEKCQPLSLEKMVEVGEYFFNKFAGSWFSPSETALILQQLQNKIPHSPLKVLVCSNEFNLTSAITFLSTNSKDNNKDQHKIFDVNGGSTIYTSPAMIVILVRIGMSSPQPQMLQSVIRLMGLKAFMGILGGKPGRAHYIVGFTDSSFVYLDPHCVKQKSGTQQFLNQHMMSMPQGKVDTSMGICFYASDYPQLIKLYEDLEKLKNQIFYSYSTKDPPRLLQMVPSDHFQLLGEYQQQP